MTPGFQKWNNVEFLLDNFEEITGFIDQKIASGLYKIIAKLDTVGGVIQPQSLQKAFAEIDQLFAKELKGKDFKEQLDKMHKLVEVITEANVSIAKQVNNIKVTDAELIEGANLQPYIESVTTSLSSAGIAQNVLIPTKKLVANAVTQGRGTKALIHDFEMMFEDNGTASQLVDIRGRSLKSYAKQISNDAVNAANGQTQLYMRDKFGLNRIRYIGNTIKDSRPFCVHMIKEEKYPMTLEKLDSVLKKYVGNKTKVRVGTNKDGSPKMLTMDAGMYPDTNTRNFLVVLGGYNCRHRGFFVR